MKIFSKFIIGLILIQTVFFSGLNSIPKAKAAGDLNFSIQVDTSAKDPDPTRKNGAKVIISWTKPSGVGAGNGYSWHLWLDQTNGSFSDNRQMNVDNLSQYWDYMDWGGQYKVRVALLLDDNANGTVSTGQTMANIAKEKTYNFTVPSQAPSIAPAKTDGTCPLNVKMVQEDFIDEQSTVHFVWPNQTGACAGYDSADITGPGGISDEYTSSPYKLSNVAPGSYVFTTVGKGGKTILTYDPKKKVLGSRSGEDQDGKPITETSTNDTKNSGTAKDSTANGCYQGTWKVLAGVLDPLGTAIQKLQCLILEGFGNAMTSVTGWIQGIMGISAISPTLTRNTTISSSGSVIHPKADFILDIWDTMRMFINVFLIFIIILVAFSNIFRINIDKYAIKKALPGMVLGVILANFSGVICKVILDASEILCNFVTGSAVGGPTMVVINAFGSVTLNSLLALTKSTLGVGILLAPFILILVLIIPMLLAGLLFLFIMALRVGILFTLYAISPLAFLALGSPMTSGLFKKWWDDFVKWAFVPVMMFFLLWIVGQITVSNNIGTTSPTWDMIKTIMGIALIWTAIFLPFKLKGFIGGAVAGMAASKIVNPGLKFAGNQGLGTWEKYATDKKLGAWATPHLGLKGWVKKGDESRASNRAIREAQGEDLKDDVFNRRGGFWGIARDVQRGQGRQILREFNTRESGDRQAQVKDQLARKKGTEKADFGRDEHIHSQNRLGNADPIGPNQRVRQLSEDELREVEASDMALAKTKDINEKFKTVMAYHKSANNMSLSPTQKLEAAKSRDQAVHAMQFKDWSEFEKKIVKAPGGITGRTAKANYFVQQYGDDRGRHMYRLCSDISVDQGDDSWHGGTRINPQTGKLEWNRSAQTADQGNGRDASGQAIDANGEKIWDWTAADIEAADLTSKREKQRIPINATYLAWAVMDEVDGNAKKGSISDYGKVVLEDQPLVLDAFWEQARKQPRFEEHMISMDATSGNSTIKNWIEYQKSKSPVGQSSVGDSIKRLAPKDADLDQKNVHVQLWKKAGLFQTGIVGGKEQITGYNF